MSFYKTISVQIIFFHKLIVHLVKGYMVLYRQTTLVPWTKKKTIMLGPQRFRFYWKLNLFGLLKSLYIPEIERSQRLLLNLGFFKGQETEMNQNIKINIG